MNHLKSYLDDGANYQAQAVMCFLRTRTIEDSWNKEFHKYDAEPLISRWENCREQGYVVSLRTGNGCDQINIAFFEHRNSDEICAVKWEQWTINAPTIDTAEFGDVYKTKHDVSHSVPPGQVCEMADWIWEQLEAFWKMRGTAKTTKQQAQRN